MTEAQAAWLRTLRDEGPEPPRDDNDDLWFDCVRAGWVDITEAAKDCITTAGLAALAEYEARG